ncbi:class I SAM-dependent methyltransferase [Agromyces sp. SYSU K20354]|uniref:class I SAM-dependent methyltransferase n=1 Tax=Agromyces cavernae TaxID=2898659 RepID=UPI001E5689F9|nr:class I SAM-dependent methyltransferase [Agromyces cavernae]MCD2444043.1 class I SAM-dependent methyltransferase [Agromyces cavernae]
MRGNRRRALIVVAIAISVVFVAIVVMLAVAGAISLGEALILIAAGALAAIGVVLCKLGLDERKSRARVEQTIESFSALRTELSTVLDGLTDLRTSNTRIDAMLADVTPTTTHSEALLEQTRSEVEALRSATIPKMVGELRGYISRSGVKDFEQYVAWSELRAALKPGEFMPPLRGWAASPDVIRLLVKVILRRKPSLVVECGSGSSSVWLGYALRRAGGGRLIALEHDASYADRTRELVTAHGLDDIVEVRFAPLVEVLIGRGDESLKEESTSRLWYDTAAIEDVSDIGVVFIDGPPASTGLEARYPALPALLPKCSDDVVIVLDDAARPDELAVGDRWLAEYPQLRRRMEPAEKGAHVFTVATES